MNQQLTITLVLAAAILLLVIWNILLERRLGKMLKGKSAATLEDTIIENQNALAKLFEFKKTTENEFQKVDERIKKKLHGAKTIRFNPFQGTGSGGNQSFATALLDEEGSGVVISSLYARDKMSIFAKPINKRNSEFELTDEEREVLK